MFDAPKIGVNRGGRKEIKMGLCFGKVCERERGLKSKRKKKIKNLVRQCGGPLQHPHRCPLSLAKNPQFSRASEHTDFKRILITTTGVGFA